MDSAAPLRAAGPADLAALQDFVRALSLGTRSRRFFAPLPELPPLLANALAAGDPRHRFVVAERRDAAGQRVVALAQLALHALPARAELALVVADDWQGQGLGRRLLARLADDARRLGAQRLEAQTQRDNRPMLGLLRTSGFALARDPGDPDLVLAQRALTEPAAQVRAPGWKKYFFSSAGVIAKAAAAKLAATQRPSGRRASDCSAT